MVNVNRHSNIGSTPSTAIADASPSKKIRIALFIPTLNVGGAERVMLLLSRGLSDLGHSVDVVLVQDEGQFLGDVPSAVRIVPLGKSRIAASVGALRDYLESARPDVLVSALDAANVVAVLAAKRASVDVPVVVTVHQHVSTSLKRDFSFKRLAILQATRWAYKRADAVVCVSNGVAADLKKLIRLREEQLFVLPNAVVTPELTNAIEAARGTRSPAESPSGKKVIVAAGRFVAQKDFETLIRAAAIARSQGDFVVHILGDGPLRPRFEALVEELDLRGVVHMPGFVSDVPERLANADLFVLSSNFEGLPTVIIEAFAAGCPVVSTDCPSGPRELLADGQYGTLVPVRDPEAMATAIVESLRNPVPASVLQERAADFSVRSSTQEYNDLVQRLVA